MANLQSRASYNVVIMHNYFFPKGEWISGCVCMYQTKILVEGYGHDETVYTCNIFSLI